MYLSLSLQVIIISTLTSVENLLSICAGMVRKLSSLITLYACIIDGQCIYVIIKSYWVIYKWCKYNAFKITLVEMEKKM